VGSQSCLAAYESILVSARQMLEAAKCGNWDRLVELEKSRSALVEDLMAQETDSVWGQHEQTQKRELIQDILAADEEIKILAESWMGELRGILGSVTAERKLLKAYEIP